MKSTSSNTRFSHPQCCANPAPRTLVAAGFLALDLCITSTAARGIQTPQNHLIRLFWAIVLIVQALNVTAAGFAVSIDTEKGGVFSIRSTRQICPATAFTLEISSDLNQWADATPFLQNSPEVTANPDGVTETVRFRVAQTNFIGSSAFFRVRGVGDPPVVDFFTSPEEIATNIRDYLVTGTAPTGQIVLINGVPTAPENVDPTGAFAVVVPLTNGANKIQMSLQSTATMQILRSAVKTVHFDQNWVSAGRLLYVECTPMGGVSLDGTIVIDLDAGGIVGFLPGAHVRGIAPSGQEIYFEDRAVLSTDHHQVVRALPFSSPISASAFLVSPDGTNLFSGDEIVDVPSNALLARRLPLSIASGSSWSGAPVPGGPGISPDGRKIYCGS
jgi:hypothetical protein